MNKAIMILFAALLLTIGHAQSQPSQISEFFDGTLTCKTVDFKPGKGLEGDTFLKGNKGRIYTLLPPNDGPLRVLYKWGTHDQEILFRSTKDSRDYYQAAIAEASKPRNESYQSIIQMIREPDGAIGGVMVVRYETFGKQRMHLWRWDCEVSGQS